MTSSAKLMKMSIVFLFSTLDMKAMLPPLNTGEMTGYYKVSLC